MRKLLKVLFQNALYLIGFLFFVNLILVSVEPAPQVVVTITVDPVRIIIVNKNLTITKIMSNTKQDIRPIVYLENEDGVELPYSESIMREYFFIKPSLDFSRPGIVYEREERLFPALIKRMIRTFFSIVNKPI